MTKVFAMESQPGVGPVMRIMNDPSYDPVTTPPTDYGKMSFDSRTTKLGYVYDIYTEQFDSRFQTGGDNNGFRDWWYFKDGDINTGSGNSADRATAGRIIEWYTLAGGRQTISLLEGWWPFGYLPIIEVRTLDPALPANTYKGAIVDYTQLGTSLYGYIQSYAGYACLASAGTTSTPLEAYVALVGGSSVPQSVISAFQLPAREDALPNFATTPIGGQNVLLISPSTTRLALPGRDVTDTNIDHYIFHEDKVPAKIMAAGDINVAGSGTATIMCPLPLTPLTYMDFMIKRQTETEFWNPPFFNSVAGGDGSLAFTYEVKTDRIVITNGTSTAITVRYVVLTDSAEPYTTGGTEVLTRDNDGTQNFVQIKRPGSSDTAPSLNDIILDSRLAYMPLLAEGFLPWSSGFPTVISGSDRFMGERKATVSFSNPAPKLLPFVKQMVVFPSDANPVTVQGSLHKVFTDSGTAPWIGRASQNSSWANVHDTSVDFYMSGDNPFSINANDGAWKIRRYNDGNVEYNALGLRYYIFGIPNGL